MNTDSDFNFNEKTGELKRGGKLLPLNYKHKRLFSVLRVAAAGEYVPIKAAAESIDGTKYELAIEAHRLRLRLRQIGIAIEGKRRVGYRLIVGEMPKWAPKIPETTTECTLRESDLVPRR